jgi:glyoxylase-like metal-dependent hydrolase (beta-lactamase superfamily II)
MRRVELGETNCYLLQHSAGTVIVDPGPARTGAKLVTQAAQAGIQPEDVRLILVTHGHLDHYGAVKALKSWCGAPVAAYRTEPDFSQNRRNALPPAQTTRGSLVRWFYLLLSPLSSLAPLEADILLDDRADLAPYGITASVMLVPGHSPGSLAVITEEGDAFVGDLLVNYTVPSQPIYLTDRLAWQESYERMRSWGPRMAYVGHGEPFPGSELNTIHPARYQLRWWVR